MSFLDSYNKSILAIPAYFVMIWVPHAYAISIASQGNLLGGYDNRNPRAADMIKKLQEKLPQDQFRKYERARAAHFNGVENMPIFAAAMILGNLARLPQADLDWAAGTFLALRAIYFVQYILNGRQQYTGIRSLLWASSATVCFRVIFAAAKKLSN